jgi:hypothetical protein
MEPLQAYPKKPKSDNFLREMAVICKVASHTNMPPKPCFGTALLNGCGPDQPESEPQTNKESEQMNDR